MIGTKTWYHLHTMNQGTGDKIADSVARLLGSWNFVIGQAVLMAIWVVINTLALLHAFHFDAYPFVFLNLFMSAEAAFSTPLILMSQNRQADRDRHQADADFQTNVAAKEEIEVLVKHLSRIETEKIDKVIEWMGVLLRSELVRQQREDASAKPPARSLSRR